MPPALCVTRKMHRLYPPLWNRFAANPCACSVGARRPLIPFTERRAIGRAGMIDIGGGSTEIALGSGDTLAHAYSLQLGASRLHKRQPINSPYDIAMALSIAAEITEPLHALQRETERLPFCLVGGTGTSVAQILAAQTGRADIEGMRLERQAVETLLGQIAATPRNQRESIPGFPAGRADILPTGMAALIAVMDALSLDHLQVTQRGNTDGLLRAFVHKKFA